MIIKLKAKAHHSAEVLEGDLLVDLDGVDAEVGGDPVTGVAPHVGHRPQGAGGCGHQQRVARPGGDLRALTSLALVAREVADVERKAASEALGLLQNVPARGVVGVQSLPRISFL